MSVHMVGRRGRLLWGSRAVTEFEAWTADEDGPTGFLVKVRRHNPDPVFWEYRDRAQAAELELGQQVCRGAARLIETDPLQFTLEPEED